jgi:phosphate transport system substrate-binding protein
MKLNKPSKLSYLSLLAALAIGGCSGGSGNAGTGETGMGGATTGGSSVALKGTITIDGSSTVFPISQAMSEEFTDKHKDLKVPVNMSGTGGGMKKFVAGEIDICGASRPIEPEEIEAAKGKGIEFVEIPVAYDGLSVVVNKENNFVDHLTVAELKKIWEPNSKVNNWKDVRAGFPDVPMKLFGAGTDSGTFEYFTEAINGKKKESRTDYTPSEDDNVLVTGVKGEKGGLGYFGYAYYIANKNDLKVVKVDGGNGPVEPTHDTINDGSYAPLSRPIFLYVSKKALERPEVMEFVKYVLSKESREFIAETGYVALPDAAYDNNLKNVQDMKVGTRWQNVAKGAKIEEVIASEAK